MNSVLLATLVGLVTLVCWGTGDWLTSKLSKKYDKFDINFTVELTSLSIMLPVMLFIGKPLPDARQLTIIGLVSLMFSAAYLLLIKALSVGSAGIVVPLANTYALITLVLTTVFVGTLFTGLQVVAIVSIVAGACMLAYEKKQTQHSHT